jgi:hypothetical protein
VFRECPSFFFPLASVRGLAPGRTSTKPLSGADLWVEVLGHVRMAADSTMLRMVKRLIALSLGVQRAQLEQRTGLTWPRPFLLRPLKNQSASYSIFEQYSKSSPPSFMFRNALLLLVSIVRVSLCVFIALGRHCGDHVEWETVSRILGGNNLTWMPSS